MCTSVSRPVARISEVRKFISEGDWASAGSMSNDIAEHAKEALSMTRFLVAPADTAQAELERLFKETFIITPKSARIEHIQGKKIAAKEVIFAQTVIGFYGDKGVDIPIESGNCANLSVIKAVDITDIYDWATDIWLATNHDQPVILSDKSFWSKPINLKLAKAISIFNDGRIYYGAERDLADVWIETVRHRSMALRDAIAKVAVTEMLSEVKRLQFIANHANTLAEDLYIWMLRHE